MLNVKGVLLGFHHFTTCCCLACRDVEGYIEGGEKAG